MQTITLAPRAAGQTIFAVGTRLELIGRCSPSGVSNPSPQTIAMNRRFRDVTGDLYTVRDPQTGRRADVFADEVLIVEIPDHPEHAECADACGLDVDHDGACQDRPGGRTVCTHERCARCTLPVDDMDALTGLCDSCDLHDDGGSIFDGTDRALLDAAGPVATTAAGLATDLVDNNECEHLNLRQIDEHSDECRDCGATGATL